jgi:hypothetical protein
MAKVQDILHTPDGDLAFRNGDFIVGDSDAQHVQDITFAMPGDFRQSPLVGVGIMNYLNGPVDASGFINLRKTIRLQLQADGYIIAKLTLAKDLKTFNVEAER